MSAVQMKKYIKEKEEALNLTRSIYQQDKEMVNKYVEYLKNEVYKKEKDVDMKMKERQFKELKLDQLIQLRANLRKKLGDNKELCATYKDHMNFMASINPNVVKIKHKSLFLTEQNDKKCTENDIVIVDKELEEIGRASCRERVSSPV